MTDKYLSIENVSKSFVRGKDKAHVLHDISLSVAKGEYISLIGHSGCGKSTLLNIVAGLTPATEGCVILQNREVFQPGPDRAVVFQNHSLLPWLTVYQNVRLAVDKVFRGIKGSTERHEWTLHNLELVHMLGRKKAPARALRDAKGTALDLDIQRRASDVPTQSPTINWLIFRCSAAA
jgi:nitrate/nitrite transport system ATP-binding protein